MPIHNWFAMIDIEIELKAIVLIVVVIFVALIALAVYYENNKKKLKVSIFSIRGLPMSRFAMQFQLSSPIVSDVAKRVLTIDVVKDGSADQVVQELVPEALVSEVIEVDSGSTLTLVLVDFDAAGNASEPSEPFVYEVIDDVAPPQPSVTGVAEKRQL